MFLWSYPFPIKHFHSQQAGFAEKYDNLFVLTKDNLSVLKLILFCHIFMYKFNYIIVIVVKIVVRIGQSSSKKFLSNYICEVERCFQIERCLYSFVWMMMSTRFSRENLKIVWKYPFTDGCVSKCTLRHVKVRKYLYHGDSKIFKSINYYISSKKTGWKRLYWNPDRVVSQHKFLTKFSVFFSWLLSFPW